MTTGENLKIELGLSKFPYVMIEKIIDFPYQFFIITLDSRRPSVYLSYSKIKKIQSTSLDKFSVGGEHYNFKKFKKTPPLEIENFNGSISSRGLVFIRDIAGEYFMNDKMYESKNNKFIEVNK